MKAPGLVPGQVRERLIVLPEAEPTKRRRRLRIAAIVALAVWTGIVAGISVYLWQRGEIRSRDRALASSTRAAAAANAQVADANGRISSLQQQFQASRGLLEQAKNREKLARIKAGEHLSQIANLRSRLDAKGASLASAFGPRLRNGDHIAYVAGIDVLGSRVLIDPGRWFTGAAARRAAERDGVVGTVVNGRYLRNPDHVLRYVHVAFGAIVTLRNVPGVAGAFHTTLSGLASFFAKGDRASDTIRLDPFWVHAQHGEIDAMTQQQYRPPS
jgi:hypothetical protein